MRNTIKNGKIVVINEQLIEKHEEPIKEEKVTNEQVAAVNEEEKLEENTSSKHPLLDAIIYKAKHKRTGR